MLVFAFFVLSELVNFIKKNYQILLFSNFKDFFISLTQSVISLNTSEISGKFKSNQDSKFILDKINKINSEIQELKAQIKKETNFNNKVKLNIELKNKKDNLLDFKEKL